MGENLKVVPVCQGELSVSGDPDVVLSCILGSCVATCLYDPRVRVGGMNHILLPGRRSCDGGLLRYGAFAMEALINEMMHLGARRRNMVARIYGGAATFDNGFGIGAANVEFVRDFLSNESIPVTADGTGGQRARRIRFYPQSGEATEVIAEAPPPDEDPARLRAPRAGGKVELF